MLTYPDRLRFQTYFIWMISLSVLFALAYGFSNHWASSSSEPIHLWFDFEKDIPLIPEFVLIYLSLNLLTLLPLFILDAKEMNRLGLAMAGSIAIACCFFVLLPAPIAWARPDRVERFDFLFQGIYQLDQVSNTFPSLHICLSYLTTRSLCKNRPKLNPIWLWFLLICMSVVFTHQHHLIDILGGALLAEFVFRKTHVRS